MVGEWYGTTIATLMDWIDGKAWETAWLENKRGPRTEPWATPVETWIKDVWQVYVHSSSAEFTNLNGCYFYFLMARAGGFAPPCSEVGGRVPRLPPHTLRLWCWPWCIFCLCAYRMKLGAFNWKVVFAMTITKYESYFTNSSQSSDVFIFIRVMPFGSDCRIIIRTWRCRLVPRKYIL